jgi:hypothetical protein
MEINSDKIQCIALCLNYIKDKNILVPDFNLEKAKLILLLMQTTQTHLRYEKITYYLQKMGVEVDDYFQEAFENLQSYYFGDQEQKSRN